MKRLRTEASFRRAFDRGVTSYFLMCQAASKVTARASSVKITWRADRVPSIR